jgi:DNA-binding IclR family transcriptional regulator
MTQQAADKLLAIVQEQGHVRLEELLRSLPELTWNQVFSLVDELSRRGLISLRRQGFDYELRAFAVSA